MFTLVHAIKQYTTQKIFLLKMFKKNGVQACLLCHTALLSSVLSKIFSRLNSLDRTTAVVCWLTFITCYLIMVRLIESMHDILRRYSQTFYIRVSLPLSGSWITNQTLGWEIPCPLLVYAQNLTCWVKFLLEVYHTSLCNWRNVFVMLLNIIFMSLYFDYYCSNWTQ